MAKVLANGCEIRRLVALKKLTQAGIGAPVPAWLRLTPPLSKRSLKDENVDLGCEHDLP